MRSASLSDASLFDGAITIEQLSGAATRLTVTRPQFDMEREALQQLHHTLGLFLRASRLNHESVQFDTSTGAAKPLLHSNLGGFL